MPGSALWAVQVAVYSVLAQDTTLQVLLGATVASPKVFDTPPENQEFPYVIIGDLYEVPDDTIGRTGKRVTVPLFAWSRAPTAKECADILNRLVELLDRVPLSITGWNHVHTDHMRSVAGRESDGATRRAAAEFQLMVSEA